MNWPYAVTHSLTCRSEGSAQAYPKEQKEQKEGNTTRIERVPVTLLMNLTSLPSSLKGTKHPLLTLTSKAYPWASYPDSIRGRYSWYRTEKIRSEIRAGDSTAEQNCRVRSPVAGRDLISQPRLGVIVLPLYYVFFDGIKTHVWVYN